MADEQNILWIANDADGVWADAFLTAALTLIVRTAGAMVRSFASFPINVSEMNRTLCKVLTFPPELLTNDFKRQLEIAPAFGERKLPDKPPPTDPHSAEDESLDSQTEDMYGDNMGDMEDFVPLEDEDEEFRDSLSAIKKEAANIKAAQHHRLARNIAVAMNRLGLPFLGPYDIKSLRAPVIACGPESFLGLQYGTASLVERNLIKLHQYRVEEARLDCLAIEICERKKESAARRQQQEDFHRRRGESVSTLRAVLALVQQNEAALAKLKQQKPRTGLLQEALNTSRAPIPLAGNASLANASPPSTSNISALPPVGGASALLPAGGASALPPAGDASAIPPAGDASTLSPAGDASAFPPAGDASALPPAGNTSALLPTSGASATPLFSNISAPLPTSNASGPSSGGLEDTTAGGLADLPDNINYLMNQYAQG